MRRSWCHQKPPKQKALIVTHLCRMLGRIFSRTKVKQACGSMKEVSFVSFCLIKKLTTSKMRNLYSSITPIIPTLRNTIGRQLPSTKVITTFLLRHNPSFTSSVFEASTHLDQSSQPILLNGRIGSYLTMNQASKYSTMMSLLRFQQQHAPCLHGKRVDWKIQAGMGWQRKTRRNLQTNQVVGLKANLLVVGKWQPYQQLDEVFDSAPRTNPIKSA